MYLLFIYDSDRAKGGRNDFVKTSDSLKECIEYFKNTKDEKQDGADIYDTKLERWYSFRKEQIINQLQFLPEESFSEESFQEEQNIYKQLNELVPMTTTGFLLNVNRI